MNIVVYFTGGGYQIAPNVNHGKNWPNNSVNMVEIPLNRPVPPGEIRALRLVHIADGGFNIHSLPELATPAAPIAIAQAFQSPDNWNMADVEVTAIGNGVSGPIANFGFHRFTGSKPDLIIDTQVPPNICGSGRQTGSSTGAGSVSSGGGGASGLPGGEVRSLTNNDVIRMVKDGMPQPTIVASIRSRRGAYEISNKAKAALLAAGGKKRASEMTEIWEGMTNVMICQETNGRGGEDWCGPDPRLPSSGSGSGFANGQLLQGSSSGSGSSGGNPNLNPIAPRGPSSASGSGGSTTGSGGANPSLQPLIPGDSSNASSGSGSTKPLTIDDVVKMLQAGLPEQAILASIRSSSADFNLSNKEKANEAKTGFFKELRKPRAGTPASAWRNELSSVWEAIAAKAAEGAGAPAATADAGGTGNGNKNADELSPQPYPPKGKSNSGAANTPTGKQFVPPPNLKVFTVAEAQNPAALTLRRTVAQLKGTGGGNIGPEGTMSAPGNVSGGTASSATASRPMLAAPTATQPSSSQASPQQPQGGARPSGKSKLGTIAPNTTGLCLNNNAGIAAVNGQRFTQFTPGTQYVITGCGFGTAPGKVYLTGTFPAHNGKIDVGPSWAFGTQRTWTGHWSDQRIDAQLDAALSGELDQYNISLVVETSTGQQIQMGNVSFQAQRAEFMLPTIPDSAVPNPPAGAGHGWCGAWLKNCTVEVLRDYTHATPTPDSYTVKLKEGFVLSRVVLLVGGTEGGVAKWTTPNINGNQIVVNWTWNTDPATNFTSSLYGLQIYVIGPLGVTNAWAGQ